MFEPVYVCIRGVVIDVMRMGPEHVSVLDIARTLSRINRYSGRTPSPYSVAQHAVLVSYLAPAKHAYDALHHDDTEAYIGDVINPIKSDRVREIETEIRNRLVAPLRLAAEEHAEVKKADLNALVMEQVLLQGLEKHLPSWPCGKVTCIRDAQAMLRPMHYLRAEELYLARHKELGGV